MFQIEELAGSLIKSGRFQDAIEVFGKELLLAMGFGVITKEEVFGTDGIIARFNRIILNPCNLDEVNKLGDDLIFIAIRIPDYVRKNNETSSPDNSKLFFD